LLRQAELIVSEKQGQFISYSLNTTVVDELLKWVLQFSSNANKKVQNKNLNYEG
jgi:hypothetical protein